MTFQATVSSGVHESLASHASALRLGVICDYIEERWPSMDLFGDMLMETLREQYAFAIGAERLRPSLRRRFSRIPGGAGLFWNADRLWNRFFDYPAWLARRAQEFDIFHLVDHSYAQLLRELPDGRTVVTCHDIDTFRCILEPEMDPRPRWFRTMAQRSLSGFLRAAHVICVSSFTRANLLEYRLFPPEKISVIPPGVDPVFLRPDGPLPDVLQSLPDNYLLHVGSTIRRKRIDVLLQVFARVIRNFPEIKLMRVGGLTAEQSRLAQELGVADKIVTVSNLSKAQLANVYRNALAVLQTSDAEGFGLPVIEAMACGCPVVASDIPPLREAGGDAAKYCPVADLDAWTETVLKLVAEYRQFPGQGELRLAASKHASFYTWTENVKRTIAVYERVCGRAIPSTAVLRS
jgi:glycosyltransferase involved in cell wall biosynthesis